MKIAIAGASGLVGSALAPALRLAGHAVVRLVRREPRTEDEIFWSPTTHHLDARQLAGVDAIVNLSGENIGASRWTAARREEIRRSRIDATRTLVGAVARADPRPRVFVSASAVGFYGDRGEEVLTEESGMGHGFLPEVCLAWETHALGAARSGVRTAVLRFGVILTGKGGALAKMLPPFRLGLGGPLGNGTQWMSWVALDDVVGAVMRVLTDEHATGPVNVVAPTPVTNAEFTATLATVLRRPAVLRVPAWGLRLALGEGMANEALLASARAIPQRLIALGFAFRHPTLEAALRQAVAGKL